MTVNLSDYFSRKKTLIDQFLEKYLPAPTREPETLFKAMRYSVLAPGKRIRPILALACGTCLDLPEQDILPIACSLEMIHVFSLIHDDLPAMDDDDLRRGQPTNHKVFGEANAILAGDALLCESFSPLTQIDTKKYEAKNILKLIAAFAKLTGVDGMIAGQVIDLACEGKKITLEKLKTLHRHKTGALIQLAVTAPVLLKGCDQEIYDRFVRFGDAIGLAFQITDDILDIEGEDIGKDKGSDIANDKATYPALLGLNGAKEEALKALDQALTALAPFGEKAATLCAIAKFIVERRN